MGQIRADVGLGLSVPAEVAAGVVAVLVGFLHRQLFTVPAPRRRTAAEGQGFQFAAHCPHWATHMHGHGCDGGGHDGFWFSLLILLQDGHQIFGLFGPLIMQFLKHTQKYLFDIIYYLFLLLLSLRKQGIDDVET